MPVAHGNTPFHDDPSVLSWISLGIVLGPMAAVSFGVVLDQARSASRRVEGRYERRPARVVKRCQRGGA